MFFSEISLILVPINTIIVSTRSKEISITGKSIFICLLVLEWDKGGKKCKSKNFSRTVL